MDATRETKIVEFDSAASILSSTCAVCETTHPQGTLCKKCVGSLLDLALLDEAREEYPYLLNKDQEGPRQAPNTDLLRYNGYEVCQTPSGLLWELGRGSMGVTYKALDTALHRIVALKVIHPAILGDVQAGELFLREARSAAQIRHQNIAVIHSLGHTESGEYFYAMEFVEGETLEDRVRREGALPYETALDLTAQAAHGLCSAHTHGFVHRDLKPTNFMLAEGGQAGGEQTIVKLIDFGLVKPISDVAADVVRIGYFAGTPHYASPEQLDGGPVGVRSDIYSLGRCLWFMLSGQMPISRFAEEAEFPPDVPPTVRELLQTLVMEEPEGRPRSATAVLGMIEECWSVLHRSYEQQHTPSRGEAAVRWNWSRMGWLSVVSALLVTLLVVVFVGKAQNRREARVLYAQGEDLRQRFTRADNGKAKELYSKAILADSGFANAHAALAITLYHDVAAYGAPAAELDRAVASAERALAINPNTPKAYHALGAIQVSRGHPWEALGYLHRALEADAKYLPAIRDFASLWTSTGQPQKGLAWAESATRLDPADVFGWAVAADTYTDLCADKEAEDCYRRCLAINPMFMQARTGLVHIRLWQGDFVRAREELLAAEAIQSGSLLTSTLKAEIEFFSGHYQEAEAIYRQLLAVSRNGMVNYYGGISYLSALGFLDCHNGDMEAGGRLLEEAAALYTTDSDGPQAIYDLAAIRSVQGRSEQALTLLKQAITAGWLDYRAMRLDPRFDAVRKDPRFQVLAIDLDTQVKRLRKDAEALCAKPLLIADYPVQPPRG